MYFPGPWEEEGAPGNIPRCSAAGMTPSRGTCYLHAAARQILGERTPRLLARLARDGQGGKASREDFGGTSFSRRGTSCFVPCQTSVPVSTTRALEMSMREVAGLCWGHGLPWAGCGFSQVDLRS